MSTNRDISATPAVIVVHGLDQARAALAAAAAADRPVTLLSAPGAARSDGPGWWRELVRQGSESVPGANAAWVLDCADEAGSALAALREGVGCIALSCGEPARGRVCEIAAACGASVVEPDRARALDLASSRDPARACAAFLSDRPQARAPGGPRDVAKPPALG
jgi:hypothetical protein